MLKRDQAARYCTERGRPVTAGTLAVFASRGTGPRFQRVGRNACYSEGDLDDWIAGTASVNAGPQSEAEDLFLQCVIAYDELAKSRSLRWYDATVAAGKAVELAALRLTANQKKRIVAFARRGMPK